jgi:hypothetical protein
MIRAPDTRYRRGFVETPPTHHSTAVAAS